MKQPVFISENNKTSLATRLSQDVVLCLQHALAERGKASLVVSGGSTPLPLFQQLSQQALDWRRITVTLADERWVPESHTDSNQRFVKQHLLTNHSAAANFVGLYVDDCDITQAVPVCEQRIAALLPFDCVVLGMGSDAHTASLFPGAPGLAEALDTSSPQLCKAMQAQGVAQGVTQARMTLTLKAILDTRKLTVHFTGEEKRRVYQQALIDQQPSQAPISAVLAQDKTPVSVYWSA